MKVAVFAAKSHDIAYLKKANESHGYELEYFEGKLNPKTAPLATGADAVCAFVNDKLSRETLTALSDLKIGLIALRCAGFNNVDLEAAKEGKIFFRDLSEYIIDDEKIMQLMTFPNVLVTAHQAFLTRKALT